MKKLIISIICIFFFITIEASFSKMIVYVSKSGNGTLKWDEAKKNCPTSGTTCNKIVTQVSPREAIITEDVTLGGTFITTTFGGMTFSVTNDPIYGSFTSIHDGKNYPFQAGDYINIVSSDEHPSLNGLSFSLNSLITNSNGEFTIFVMIP